MADVEINSLLAKATKDDAKAHFPGQMVSFSKSRHVDNMIGGSELV